MGHAFRAVLVSFLATSALPATADDAPASIVLIGDSYISSYGVDSSESFGVQLQSALTHGKQAIHVVDTGYTETSIGGVRRLDNFLTAPSVLGSTEKHAVILELGQNDCNPFKLEDTRANLDQMLARLAETHIPVLLVGTTPYDHCERAARPNYKALYVRMFAELAAHYGDLYYRDFKDGVSGHPELLQDDRDHPNAQGEAVIVARMLSVVQELVDRMAQP